MPENTDGNEKYPYFVFAKLVEQLLPDERERLYAAPLTVFLEERKLGTVTAQGNACRESSCSLTRMQEVVDVVGDEITKP